jgi:hypothetical protein
MSWALKIELVLPILVESNFSLTWDQCHWKLYLVLFSCICRTSKSKFVCAIGNQSWIQVQILEFQIGLDLHQFRIGLNLQLIVHISWALQHVLDVLYVILIISMVRNNN